MVCSSDVVVVVVDVVLFLASGGRPNTSRLGCGSARELVRFPRVASVVVWCCDEDAAALAFEDEDTDVVEIPIPPSTFMEAAEVCREGEAEAGGVLLAAVAIVITSWIKGGGRPWSSLKK